MSEPDGLISFDQEDPLSMGEALVSVSMTLTDGNVAQAMTIMELALAMHLRTLAGSMSAAPLLEIHMGAMENLLAGLELAGETMQ